MARAGTADQVWRALASGLLYRYCPVVLLPCRDRAEPEFALDSDCRWRNRNIAHDGRRIWPDLVKTARSRTLFARSNWRTRMTGGLALVLPAITAAFQDSLGQVGVRTPDAVSVVTARGGCARWRCEAR